MDASAAAAYPVGTQVAQCAARGAKAVRARSWWAQGAVRFQGAAPIVAARLLLAGIDSRSDRNLGGPTGARGDPLSSFSGCVLGKKGLPGERGRPLCPCPPTHAGGSPAGGAGRAPRPHCPGRLCGRAPLIRAAL